MWFRGRKHARSKKWVDDLNCIDLTEQTGDKRIFRVKEEDLYVVEVVEGGESRLVVLTCTCDLPVNRFAKDIEEYFCQHCDRVCNEKDCSWCKVSHIEFERRFGKRA